MLSLFQPGSESGDGRFQHFGRLPGVRYFVSVSLLCGLPHTFEFLVPFSDLLKLVVFSPRIAPHYHELLDFCLFRTVGSGTLDVCLPMGGTPFPAISAADIGGCVMSIFDDPGQYSGLCIDLVGSYMPMSDYCKVRYRFLFVFLFLRL